MTGSGDDHVVPVVTSVVGPAESDAPATTSAPTTTAPSTSTTVRDFGESERPIEVPTTPAPAVAPNLRQPVENVALEFLKRLWAPRARTSAQVADDIAPFATDRILSLYRDPIRADQAVPGSGIGDIRVQVLEATLSRAEVNGWGTKVDEPSRRTELRTLTLVPIPPPPGSNGPIAWLVDDIK